MVDDGEIGRLREELRRAEAVQAELDRRVFHLRTLYDVSKDILGSVDAEEILRSFLLMTMGNFGVAEGCALLLEGSPLKGSRFVALGMEDASRESLKAAATAYLEASPIPPGTGESDAPRPLPGISFAIPFWVEADCRGILGLGPKIVGEAYGHEDQELLSTLVNNLAVALRNARAFEEIRQLNRAKDKVINHLSHELKTPLSLLGAALNMLGKRLSPLPEAQWRPTLERAQRNLQRLVEMQYLIDDIMQDPGRRSHALLSSLLDQCADELESLVAEQVGEGPVVARIRERIDALFGDGGGAREWIHLPVLVEERIRALRQGFSHREVALVTAIEGGGAVHIPRAALEAVVEGLVKNAVENTPDEGRIQVGVRPRDNGVELRVQDWGVGIVAEHQRRIFEGFFPTQEIIDYSTKRPYAFNAGGKGADLLRMKIFSERFGFKIGMVSQRCRHIPRPQDVCPGRISRCGHCAAPQACYESGGSTFTILFPAFPKGDPGAIDDPEMSPR